MLSFSGLLNDLDESPLMAASVLAYHSVYMKPTSNRPVDKVTNRQQGKSNQIKSRCKEKVQLGLVNYVQTS
jgi:hypothetical protein